MTCIVGIEHEGDVYIGGDSASVETQSLTIDTSPSSKVFVTSDNRMVMGFCGSWRVSQLMQHSLVLPPQPKSKDDFGYLVTTFMDAVRNTQTKSGAILKDRETESSAAVFLLGYKSKLYLIESDFQVGVPSGGVGATGCGADLALGALYATRHVKDPQRRILTALEAAATYNAGVRAPFNIVKLPSKKTGKGSKLKCIRTPRSRFIADR